MEDGPRNAKHHKGGMIAYTEQIEEEGKRMPRTVIKLTISKWRMWNKTVSTEAGAASAARKD